jgi:hypothetical protein
MTQRSIFLIPLLTCSLAIAVAQETSSGTLDRDKVTAGQAFHLKVTLAEAPTYATSAEQLFDYKGVQGVPVPQNTALIVCSGQTSVGGKEVELECKVPIDADGGIYRPRPQFLLLAPPGHSKQRSLNIKVPDIEIVPVPDTNVYPSSAVATISLDQKQVLTNGAEKIDYLLDKVNTAVEGHAAETRDLRTYLANQAVTAQGELQKVRDQYRQALPNGKAGPIFFQDFERQLDAFITDARSPVGNRGVAMSKTAHIIAVQNKLITLAA